MCRQVHMYSMHGQKLPRSFSLGSEAAAERITDCVVYGDGLVALTGAHRLWTVSNLEEPRPQKLALSGLTEPPHCFAVIEPRHTLSGCVEVCPSGRLPASVPQFRVPIFARCTDLGDLGRYFL